MAFAFCSSVIPSLMNAFFQASRLETSSILSEMTCTLLTTPTFVGAAISAVFDSDVDTAEPDTNRAIPAKRFHFRSDRACVMVAFLNFRKNVRHVREWAHTIYRRCPNMLEFNPRILASSGDNDLLGSWKKLMAIGLRDTTPALGPWK